VRGKAGREGEGCFDFAANERRLRSARRLTLVAVMIGVLTCPFAKHPCGAPTGEGMGTVPFLVDGLGFSPVGNVYLSGASGRRERGLFRRTNLIFGIARV